MKNQICIRLKRTKYNQCLYSMYNKSKLTKLDKICFVALNFTYELRLIMVISFCIYSLSFILTTLKFNIFQFIGNNHTIQFYL